MPPRLPIIDTDIHPSCNPERVADFLPEPWKGRYARGNRGPGVLGYWNPIGLNRMDARTPDGQPIASAPDTLARHYLDEYGIEFGVLNPEGAIHHSVAPDMDFSNAVLAAINDVLVHDWLPVEERFRASLNISAVDPEFSVREIERLGDHPGIVQVQLGSGARIPYGQRFYHPIYAAAEAKGLPVAIHPGNEGAGVTGGPNAAGYPTSYIEWHTTLVTSYISHLVSLVTEGVFVKFPRLRVVFLEAGISWLPPIMWRLDKNWMALRKTTPWLERKPSEYIQEHLLMSTQPIEEPDDLGQLRSMLEMFDAGRMLMFSSDYPHWDGDTPDFAARPFVKELRPRVMSETARELYGLPQSATMAREGETAS